MSQEKSDEERWAKDYQDRHNDLAAINKTLDRIGDILAAILSVLMDMRGKRR